MNKKEINAKRVAEVHKYLFPELSEEIKKIYDGLIKRIDELEKENGYWEQTHDYDIRMIDEVKSNSTKILQENRQLKEQLKYLRSGEYLNQLKFERDMLQNVVDNGEVSKEDKEFIDMTHRNAELLQELRQRDEVIDEAIKYIEENTELEHDGDEYGYTEWIDIKEQNIVFINSLLAILQKYKGDNNANT